MHELWMYVLIAAVCAGASLLTFFAGFGLGTILMPVFALFFPLDQAVALTAIVHLGNNVMKAGLMGRSVEWGIALRFGFPALLGALLGALSLQYLGMQTQALGPVLGSLLIFFALLEVIPVLKQWQVSPRWLVPGGLLSGFLGGLSGHQGALRTVFLRRVGLSKEAFVATGMAIALAIDISRLSVYASADLLTQARSESGLLLTGLLAAFAGAVAGKYYLQKTTMDGLQKIIAVALVLFGVYLIFK
jgi:uncharacterized membrane protein YfcA